MLIAVLALYQFIPTAAHQADNRGKEGLIGLGDLFQCLSYKLSDESGLQTLPHLSLKVNISIKVC